MTSPADPAIRAMRTVHADLAARVGGYSDDDLVRRSGAADWTVAQVLSHLGSGAEIAHAGLDAALSGAATPDQSFNESVWARWNGLSPRQQADGCIEGDAALVAAYEALDDTVRNDLRFPLPFLPEPAGLDVVGAMRLNESALHSWDVAVADDPGATTERTAVPVLVDALAGPLSVLVGFLGRGSASGGVLAVHTVDPDRDFTLQTGEEVSLRPSAPADPDGTLTLPAEAFLRLLSGRLGADRTPEGVTATGSQDLAALRATFPGF